MASSSLVLGRSRVTVVPEAGRIVVQPARRLDCGGPELSRTDHYRRASSQETGFSRARTRMTDFAVINHLDSFIDLTYAHAPESASQADHQMSLFLKRFRRRCPHEPWVTVLHRGDRNGRLHHHLLLRSRVARPTIAQLWEHGFVRRGLRPTADDIRASAFYMARGFDAPEDERTTSRRYRISKVGQRPKATTYNIATTDVDEFTTRLAGGKPIRRWFGTEDQPWLGWIGYFEP